MPLEQGLFKARRSGRGRWLTAGFAALVVLVAGVVVAPGMPAVAAPTPAGGRLERPDAGSARALARSTGKDVLVTGRTTSTSLTYARPDGLSRSEVSPVPVRVGRADGSWADVDYDLTRVPGGWAPKVSPQRVVFSAGGAGPAVSLGSGTLGLGMSWGSSLPAPAIAGNSAFYRLTGTETLVLSATSDGFEQSLRLSAPPAAAPRVRLGFDLTGLDMIANSTGGYDFVRTGDRSAMFTMPKPSMYSSQVVDEEHTQQRSVPATVRTGRRGIRYLELTGDMAFLTDPATVYPVWIDPTVSSVSRYGDTYVTQADTVAHVSDPDLRIGLSSANNLRRSLIRFNTAGSLPAGTQLVSATLALYNNGSSTCSARSMYAYPITQSYAVSTVTWATQPAYTTSSAYSASASFSYGNETLGCSNATGYITVTNMVKAWLAGTLADWGLLLKAGSETDMTYAKYFCSMNVDTTGASSCTTSARYPTLSLVYNTPPDVPDRRSMTPGDSADAGTVTPTLHAAFSDPDGDQGTVQYEVYTQAGTLKASGSSATVASGADAPWTVPAGKLAAGTTYRWRTRAVDSLGLAGGWSPFKYFNTQSTSITGEQRRFQFEKRTLNDRLEMQGNVANGNLLLHATDLQIRGTGIDFTLDRYYNSRSVSVSALGKGWTMGVGQDVKLLLAGTNPTTSDVTFVAPTFYTARFDYDTTGSSAGWRHPPGVDADLSYNSGTSEWRLKFQKSEGSYFFNTSGQMIRQEDRNHNKITFGYTAGLLTTVTDTQGRVITLAYTSGRLDTVTDPTGRVLHYYYTSDGNVSDFYDADGKDTNYRYDPDQLVKITTPGGAITNITYLGDGTRRVNDFSVQYDPGNGTSTSAVTSFAYSAGETKVTDPNGNSTTSDSTDGITTYRYDDRDRVTKVIDALGHTQDKKYTSGDNIATLTDALLKPVTFGWDPNDENLTSVSLPTGAKSTMTYGDATHPHSVTNATDPQGNTMGYSYDTAGNKTLTSSSQYPGASIETKSYNSNGTVKYVRDGLGNETDYTYDTNGNLTKITNPAPLGNVSVTPDPLSRLKTIVDGKGQTTSYTYDPIDRQDLVTYQDGSKVDQQWDADGNLTQVTDPTGITTFAYNKMNRQIRKTLPSNEQIRYQYDHNGNLAVYTDSGGDVAYGYDQVNNLTSLLEPGATTAVTFGYNEDNRRTTITYPTSTQTVVNLTYDDSGRQKTIKATAGATTLTDYTYSYTKNGADTALRQSVTDTGTTTTYGYDGLNRLTSATGGISRSYGYDIDFNRTSKTESGTTTTYGFNAASQLTTVNGATTYSYDANGNLTGGAGFTLGYNLKNQTTNITAPGGTLNPLGYAGQDQTERTQAGTTTFTTSALGVASMTTGGNTDYYTRDNNGNLISLRHGTNRYYYLTDGLSSIVGLVDTTGTKVATYSYDPYGKQLTVTGTVVNPWRYASGYQDPTGLTKFGARYYNPDLGNFTQRDPSGKDLPYPYAGCNPTNNTDPTGLCSASEQLGYILGTFGLGTLLEGAGTGGEAIAGAVAEGVVAGTAIGSLAIGLFSAFAGGLAIFLIYKLWQCDATG